MLSNMRLLLSSASAPLSSLELDFSQLLLNSEPLLQRLSIFLLMNHALHYFRICTYSPVPGLITNHFLLQKLEFPAF